MEDNHSSDYARGKDAGKKEVYSENQINATIIGSHGSFSPEFDMIFLGYRDNRPCYLKKEKKIDLHNNDLTTGFLSTDMMIWDFCSADYLSKIINLEKILGVDLTRHYNRYARTMIYAYALSKGGGNAAKTAKKQYIESSSYETQNMNDLTQKKPGIGNAISGFFSKLPKTKEPLGT